MFHRIEHVLKGGLGVAGALVTVYVTGTTTKASLYATNNTSQPIANPVTTDANGRYSFYIPSGAYDEMLAYGAVSLTETYIQMFDVSGTVTPDWGDIGGTLSDQADLAAALAAKVAASGLNELIDDRIAALLVAGANVTLNYDDAAGTLTIASSGGGGGSAAPTVVSKSATYTETATSGELVILCTGTFTINLPTAVGNGAKINVKCLSGAVTVDPFGSQTIDGGATAVVNVAGASITIVSDGTNWEIV